MVCVLPIFLGSTYALLAIGGSDGGIPNLLAQNFMKASESTVAIAQLVELHFKGSVITRESDALTLTLSLKDFLGSVMAEQFGPIEI